MSGGNPWAGEVVVWLGAERRVAKLTLGALAELEAGLGADSLLALVERFEAGRFAARDVLALLVAGLRGGGWQGDAAALVGVEIGAGPPGELPDAPVPVVAARLAAQLLARAFTLPPVAAARGGDG